MLNKVRMCLLHFLFFLRVQSIFSVYVGGFVRGKCNVNHQMYIFFRCFSNVVCLNYETIVFSRSDNMLTINIEFPVPNAYQKKESPLWRFGQPYYMFILSQPFYETGYINNGKWFHLRNAYGYNTLKHRFPVQSCRFKQRHTDPYYKCKRIVTGVRIM